jgi:hypothetical protein
MQVINDSLQNVFRKLPSCQGAHHGVLANHCSLDGIRLLQSASRDCVEMCVAKMFVTLPCGRRRVSITQSFVLQTLRDVVLSAERSC